MDSNQQRFVEDALDLLNELDEGLLQLEANPQASAPLEQVFRTMHTIKGGANMFGFENIGELAHHLETLYDMVRQGKLQVTDGLISITLHAFDKVRDLLREKDANKIAAAESLQEHLQIAVEFLATAEAATGDLHHTQPFGNEVVATVLVRITPTISITDDGNHPLVFIIQDLAALGTSRVIVRKKETGDVLNWDVVLYSTATEEEIGSYFIFVENECTVFCKKLASVNLFEVEEFNNTFEHRRGSESIDTLVEFASKFDIGTTADEDDSAPASKKKVVQESYIKVSKRKIDDLLNWISELIILQAQLTTAASKMNSAEVTEVTEHLEMITGRLRDTSLEIGLVPIETLVTKFKRLVRDLSKSLSKKINFISEGAETEMDKDVIELMSDPMIHIIRNCIDHGIEAPADRKAAGKSEHGTVKLKAFNTSSYVNIVISDDGKGISKERVLRKAIDKGLVSPEDSLTDEEVLNLIFHPGLSTADTVTDVSGRGVGMDVVKQKINDLRGYVTIQSTEGKGTAIHIKLPLSRSIIEGLLVRVDDTRYIVPLHVVERIDRIPYQMLDKSHQINKDVIVNEEPLSIFSLREQFHKSGINPKTSDIISVMINGIKKGIAVDRIEGKMQTVMKPLGDAYQNQDFIAGSTILGDGSLALVLDPGRLFQLQN